MKHFIQNTIFAFFVGVGWMSCVKDKPNSDDSKPAINQHPKVFIANEGVFNGGNAELSYIDLTEQKLYNNIYQAQNNTMLGDVFQSITAKDNLLYLVINNSNKIVVVDKTDFKHKGEIAVPQPRYMVMLDGNKALVSSMYRSKLYVVDVATMQVDKEIPVKFANTEGMLRMNNKVYICPWDKQCNYIYQFDIVSQQIEDSIYISGFAPTQVLADKNNALWVMAGNPYLNAASGLTQVDPNSKQILKQFTFPAGAEVIKPTFNPQKDILYYLGIDYDGNAGSYNGLYAISIEAQAAPLEPILAAQPLQYFWGLGVNPNNGHIFIGDPRGWIQSGIVSELNADGTFIQSYTVGLGPGYFHFD